ncbi:unnamed protein product [Microthlaspi erraticum]|uniref:Uncharacterized protein n=1 Tax=Microthlaspi erraticum TaxID=1685480 RepID=A0A6D2JDB8_9BRAS|nr:unnamed protein product [Microthlaspi erraticum]
MVKKIYHKKNVHSWRDLDGRAEPLHARPCPLKPPNTPSHLIPSASHPSHLTTLAFHHYHHSTAFTILQKRSYSQKSEDCSRQPIENQRRTAHTGRENECSALGQYHPTVSAKVHGRSHTTRETLSRGRPNTTPPRTTARATGNNASRPRNSRTAADIRPTGKARPSRPKTIGQTSSVRPAGRPKSPATTVPTGPDPTVRPIVPTDRPNAAVDPKPFLKPNPHNSSPKPAPT